MDKNPLKVLITIPIAEDLIKELRQVSPRLEITQINTHRAEDIPLEIWLETEILYTDRVLPAPEQVPNLRWVQFHFTGIEFVADSPLSGKSDLIMTHQSGASAPQVAEFVMMGFLAMGHRLPLVFTNQVKADWPRDRWERFQTQELRNSTVGIVGYGSVGREIARLLQPYHVKILAVKRDLMHPEDSSYFIDGLGDPAGDLFTRLYPMEALGSVLKECDFVTVNLPLTNQTKEIIKAEHLEMMKPSAYLVVVGRGGVIDQDALADLLNSRKIAGAVLDTFPDEPLLPNSPFWKMPNVIVSPHVSGISPRYDGRCMVLFAENIRRYLGGEEMLNLYRADLGY
jgi:phosphoglycerate dehydrogenase-like enzyme